MVDFIFRSYDLNRRQDRDFRQRQAERMSEFDGILDDVDLVFECRIDVKSGIGDIERPRIVRSVDNKDMTHASRGPQFFFMDDRAHEFVSVEAAFHQRLDLAIARQRDRLRRCRVAVFRRYKFVARDVEPGFFRCGADLSLGSDQEGTMSFSLAASIAPWSETVSTGCTTAVRIGVSPRAFSISSWW